MNTINMSYARNPGHLFSLTLALFISTLGLTACQQAEEKMETAQENVAAASQDLKEAQRDVRAEWQENWLTFKRDNDKDIAVNERRILDLRKEVDEVDFRYRSGYTTRIDQFERTNNELGERVNNYKDAGDDKWEEFKGDFTRDMDALQASLESIDIQNN